jgi:hypothetical protein
MSKKRKRYSSSLPPEGLWISPDGERFEVYEHLIALRERPDIFGLPESLGRADVKTLRDIAVALIEDGWIRYRYLAGVHAFEVNSAKKRMGDIEDVLVLAKAGADETTTISQLTPKREFEAKVSDVFDRTIFGFQENPKRNKWRLSR